MDAPAASVLAHALWPSLTLAIVALWVAAILDITRHRRGGSFTSAGLLGVATLVSVVAVVAVAGMSAVLAGPWVEAVSGAGSDGMQASKSEYEGSSRAYIFSFGLENASYGSPADSTGAKESQNSVPR
jgi:hypothetical protein